MAAKKKSTTRAISSWDELDAAGIGIGYQPMSFAEEPAAVAEQEKQTFARRIGDTAVQDMPGFDSLPTAQKSEIRRIVFGR